MDQLLLIKLKLYTFNLWSSGFFFIDPKVSIVFPRKTSKTDVTKILQQKYCFVFHPFSLFLSTTLKAQWKGLGIRAKNYRKCQIGKPVAEKKKKDGWPFDRNYQT